MSYERNRSRTWRLLLDKAQYITTVLGAAVELYTRSAGVAFFLGGAVLCAVSVKGVKRLIRQPRPPNHLSRKTTYGMPSTHSATISYFAASVLLASGYLPLHPAFPDSPLFRASAALGMSVWALLVSASRIWLGHHSVLQVAVGSAYGIGFAATWFALWTSGGWNAYGRTVEEELLTKIFCMGTT